MNTLDALMRWDRGRVFFLTNSCSPYCEAKLKIGVLIDPTNGEPDWQYLPKLNTRIPCDPASVTLSSLPYRNMYRYSAKRECKN